MEQFQKELAMAASRAGGAGVNMQDQFGSGDSGLNPYANDGPSQAPGPGMRGPKPPGLENFTEDQIIKMYKALETGEVDPELEKVLSKYQPETQPGAVGPDGKPIVDSEGGAVVQPEKGFVVKTKDVKTGGKVFVNMTKHEFVEPFQQKYIPQGEREQYGGEETGVRIPLSLGGVREECDKKGEPAQVYDVIWAPKTVDKCFQDPAFRQAVVELAFNYIQQKFNQQLDLRFSMPKMKYKGATVQFQRIKAKQGPKIQEVELSAEERAELERKAFEEQKMAEALAEKRPDWQLFYDLEGDESMMTKEYWTKLIDDQFEQKAGDENDRWNTLRESFAPKQEYEIFEEFDGLNHQEAHFMVLVVNLPMLVRGHSVILQMLDDVITLRVPNLYKLQLCLPSAVEHKNAKSFFDCKIRKLVVVAPLVKPKVEELEEDTEQQQEPVAVEVQKVQDTRAETAPEPDIPSTEVTEDTNSLLFDVV